MLCLPPHLTDKYFLNFEKIMKRLIYIKTAIALLILICHLPASAQVCTGSLGDPQVNVTFGSGSNPGSPLQAASTTYTFTSVNCPPDGSYTLVNSTAACFGNTWHTVTEDHTPNDINGYMMLINASVNPGVFYIDTVKNLCANTTYEFAAWIMNVILPTACSQNPKSPKLLFSIETITGTVLGTYSTGDIPALSAPAWKQYGLFFTTPVNTNDVVIRLSNTAAGGCGNDLILDDITFRPCGPTVTTATPNNNLTAVDICKGATSNVSFSATIGPGYLVPASQWQQSQDNGVTWQDIAGATTTNYQFTQTAVGGYKYRLSVAEGTNVSLVGCRVASNPVSITIHDLPAATATSNSPVCEKQVITLNAAGGNTYTWSGPAGFTSATANPSFLAQTNSGGQYDVTVNDQFGCKSTAAVNVVTQPKPTAAIAPIPPFCEGSTVTLQAGGGKNYNWLPVTGLSAADIPNPFASPVDTTTYTVVVSGNGNCTDTAKITLNVLKKPLADAGSDKILLKGQSIILTGKAIGSSVSSSWTPASYLNNPLLLQPIATPLIDITYTLTVTSNAGCGTVSDDVFVKVYNDIYVPSAFSPNGDRLNDSWRVETLIAVPDAQVMIYNRYGKIVYAAKGIDAKWDGTYKGKPLPAGAYAYMIDLKNGRPLIKGMVMLLR